MNDGLVARLRLARAENVGPRAYRTLVRRFGSPEAALEALPRLAERGGRPGGAAPPDPAEIERELEGLGRIGARCLAVDDPSYPPLLERIYDPPPVLTILGEPDLLARPTVAMVGARNASASGRRFAETLARGLAEAGYVVVSGLARGIDAAAHVGALGGGATAAVVAGGVDVVYPPENEALQRRIAERGLLVSDQPLGVAPRAGHFPRRNRIVAGLSLGVVVVEAGERSGALITARLAADNGRDVFAVPGSPLDPRARGPNRLLKDGAALVEHVDDIVDGLSAPGRRALRLAFPPDPPEAVESDPEPPGEPSGDSREKVFEALGTQPVEVDELVRRCQVTAAEAQILLLELELAGRIERLPGNRVALAPP